MRRRELLWLAVADEEAGGGAGTAFLLARHPALFARVEAVIGEGGLNRTVLGRTLSWGVEVAQKRPLWLDVVARGRPGHASGRNPESTAHRLIAGLARALAAPEPWRVTPAARRYFEALAPVDPQARAVGGELDAIAASGRPTGAIQLQYWGNFNVPSRALHNSQRWYLTTLSVPGEYYGDGVTQRSEVFALRGDYHSTLNNNVETRVQLTNDPTLLPAFGWFQGMHWLPGDGMISFKGRRWLGAEPVEGGLYTATLVYRADGNIVGTTAQPTAPALSFALGADGWPAVGRHSWGLSTTQVAYIDSPETGLWVANLSTGTRTRIYSGSVGYLDWSQDGTKILFGSGTIRTVKPNGTGRCYKYQVQRVPCLLP